MPGQRSLDVFFGRLFGKHFVGELVGFGDFAEVPAAVMTVISTGPGLAAGGETVDISPSEWTVKVAEAAGART